MQKQNIHLEKFIKDIGYNIKKLREQKKATKPKKKEWMTQEWMDDKQEYGIDLKYYQNIEQGRQNITLKTIFKNIDFKS